MILFGKNLSWYNHAGHLEIYVEEILIVSSLCMVPHDLPSYLPEEAFI